MSSGDYISKSAFVDSIMENVVITTEEGLELRGEIVDLIKNQPTLDEKEIIRKAFERVVERLEEEARNYKDGVLQKLYFETGVARSIQVVKEEGGIE